MFLGKSFRWFSQGVSIPQGYDFSQGPTKTKNSWIRMIMPSDFIVRKMVIGSRNGCFIVFLPGIFGLFQEKSGLYCLLGTAA